MAKKHSSSSSAASSDRLGPLIDQLGPINNACRRAEGIDKVELLWDFGDVLLRFDAEASDDLLWSISERSYMTRDLLRYALIIRRSWPQRNALRKTFPRLAQYTLFREALPFLKGDRSSATQAQYEEIVARLNNRPPQETKAFLLALKTQKIGRKHKKGQAVAKMSQVAEAVRTAITQLIEIATGDSERVSSAREAVGTDGFLVLSQCCMAVAEDQNPPSLAGHSKWPQPFDALGSNLLLVGESRENRAGFRKAVGNLALMEAADALNALRSDEGLERWKRRRGLSLSV